MAVAEVEQFEGTPTAFDSHPNLEQRPNLKKRLRTILAGWRGCWEFRESCKMGLTTVSWESNADVRNRHQEAAAANCKLLMAILMGVAPIACRVIPERASLWEIRS